MNDRAVGGLFCTRGCYEWTGDWLTLQKQAYPPAPLVLCLAVGGVSQKQTRSECKTLTLALTSQSERGELLRESEHLSKR